MVTVMTGIIRVLGTSEKPKKNVGREEIKKKRIGIIHDIVTETEYYHCVQMKVIIHKFVSLKYFDQVPDVTYFFLTALFKK